jgi:hypothetical protein
MFEVLKAARRRCRAVLIGFLSNADFSQAAAPVIDSISPLAIRPGVATEVIFSGSDLSDATQLWTSFPAKWNSLGEGRFRITADVTLGVGALRVFGSNGVSNLGFIVLDDSSTIAETRTNKTRATAQRLDFGAAVDGRCEELSYDWFQFSANKGQRVSVETVAARLGSKMDSVLRIVNAAGRELARNDDAPGMSGDSLLNFTPMAAGHFFIEVRDVNYGGGSSFFYRLRVGVSPLANSTFFVSKNGVAPEIIEREPNDTAAKATKTFLTNSISGRFNKAGDRDWYEFTANKGERIEFRAATRSLGSPCDAVLQIHSADGKRLARSNPSAADEGMVTHSFTSNGLYRLAVEETTGAFGSNMSYRITARPAAGFALTLDTDRVNVAPGKSFDLKVTVTRGDHKGAVTLGLNELPETFTFTNNVIAEGKTNVTMKVTAPETVTPGTWQTFSVYGAAKRDGKEACVRASTAPALRRQLPLVLHPPPELDGVVALGVTQPK